MSLELGEFLTTLWPPLLSDGLQTQRLLLLKGSATAAPSSMQHMLMLQCQSSPISASML